MKELEAFQKLCPDCSRPAALVPAPEALWESDKGAYRCESCGIRMNLHISRGRFAKLLLPLTIGFATLVIALPAEHASRLFLSWSTTTIIGIAYVLWTSPLKKVESPPGDGQTFR